MPLTAATSFEPATAQLPPTQDALSGVTTFDPTSPPPTVATVVVLAPNTTSGAPHPTPTWPGDAPNPFTVCTSTNNSISFSCCQSLAGQLATLGDYFMCSLDTSITLSDWGKCVLSEGTVEDYYDCILHDWSGNDPKPAGTRPDAIGSSSRRVSWSGALLALLAMATFVL